MSHPVFFYFSKLEHKTDEYAKINPFQTVPAIEHNGTNIIESVAILRYLTNTHKVEDHWYPKEPLAQAKIEEYLNWQHLNTRF
jgi:glutathione S-transferase